jgi:hypothetical protein
MPSTHLEQLRFSSYPMCLLGSVLQPFEDRLRLMVFHYVKNDEVNTEEARQNVIRHLLATANAALRRGGKPVRLVNIEVVPKKFHRVQVRYENLVDGAHTFHEFELSLYAPSNKNKNTEDGEDADAAKDTGANVTVNEHVS